MDDADGKTLELSELMAIALNLDRNDGVDFGLNLSDGKAIFEQIQAQIAQRQVDQMAMKDRSGSGCGAQRSIHD
jgi:hypothetical protein